MAESLSQIGSSQIFGPTKNSRVRSVVLPAFLRDRLNAHLAEHVAAEPDALMFTASNGSPLRNSNFARNVFKPALGIAGLPGNLRIHDLRHTTAALLIRQGGHPEAIKRQLGHSSILVTMDTYGHLFPFEAEALAERMNELFLTAQTDRRRTNEALPSLQHTNAPHKDAA